MTDIIEKVIIAVILFFALYGVRSLFSKVKNMFIVRSKRNAGIIIRKK